MYNHVHVKYLKVIIGKIYKLGPNSLIDSFLSVEFC